MEEKELAGENVSPVVNGGKGRFDFLELVYGVLFDPVATMKRVALQPPLGLAVLIVTIITLIVATMGMFTFIRVAGGEFSATGMGHLMPVIQSMMPLMVILSLLFGYLKWIVYSSVLHLIAEFLGGTGQAKGVFTVAGLAGLPSIFIIPFQFLVLLLGSRNVIGPVLFGLAGFSILVWSVVLLVIGLAQVHQLSASRAVLVVFIPLMVVFVILFVFVMAVVSMIFSTVPHMNYPGYF